MMLASFLQKDTRENAGTLIMIQIERSVDRINFPVKSKESESHELLRIHFRDIARE